MGYGKESRSVIVCKALLESLESTCQMTGGVEEQDSWNPRKDWVVCKTGDHSSSPNTCTFRGRDACVAKDAKS
jgi:hypothetical protein